MRSEWKECEFQELYDIPSRNGLSKPSRIRGNGYKMINMGELFSHDRIYNIPMELVPLTDSEKINAQVKAHDLLFARQSLVAAGAGKCSIVMETSDLTVFESHLIRVRLNQSIANPFFFYYYFKSSNSPIKMIIQHCVQAGIKASDLSRLIVKFPDISTQNKIATILMALDDKIEHNTAINENLEQQAQALFKAWFVDFEPFGGIMPDNWRKITLGDIATISTKSMNPLKQPELFLEHYSIPAYDEQHYPVFEYANDIKSNKYILTNNSVMISKLNPDTKRIWRPLCLSQNPVCSTEFIVYEPVTPNYRDYIYSLIDNQMFSDYLCSHTTGSTNSRQRATPKTTLDFPCILPDNQTIANFCSVVTPLYDSIALNLTENQRLSALRDTLLPKLMSGEIDVSEVKI